MRITGYVMFGQGLVEKVVLECESLLSRFFEIQMFLYNNSLDFEENRTSKLVHSGLVFQQSLQPPPQQGG